MPHYNRPQPSTDAPVEAPKKGAAISDDVAEGAGAALRETEVDAKRSDSPTSEEGEFERLTWEELQRLAVAAGIPQQELSSDRAQLILAIQRRRARR